MDKLNDPASKALFNEASSACEGAKGAESNGPLLLGLAAERPYPPIPQQLSAAASEACIPLAGLLPCAVAHAHPLYIIQSHAMLDVN